MNHWHGDLGCNNIGCSSYQRKSPLAIETTRELVIARMLPEQAESIAWACRLHAYYGWNKYGEWAYDLEQAVEKVDPQGRPGITIKMVAR